MTFVSLTKNYTKVVWERRSHPTTPLVKTYLQVFYLSKLVFWFTVVLTFFAIPTLVLAFQRFTCSVDDA